MSGESAVGESVSFAELEILKGKHETLSSEHETSISTIELLEKKLKEALLVEQKGEYWEKKYLELLKKLETVENSIKDLMYSEVAGEDSGAAALGEDRKGVFLSFLCFGVSHSIVCMVLGLVNMFFFFGFKLYAVVIVLSDDDEGDGSESSGGDSDSENQENLSFYL